jgi:hypothetical protein
MHLHRDPPLFTVAVILHQHAALGPAKNWDPLSNVEHAGGYGAACLFSGDRDALFKILGRRREERNRLSPIEDALALHKYST